jgi:predicted RNase H-like nuclease
MPVFIGLDLAWTPHHETGICILEGDARSVRLLRLDCCIDTPDGFARLCDSSGADVVAAIDAPLLVHPDRRAERELGTVFGKYKAGAYSANLPFLTKMNGLAGPLLAEALRSRGFDLAPSRVSRETAGRFALEVFPHPAHVVLFGLDERIPYKKGPVAARRAALLDYQSRLRRLFEEELPGVLSSQPVGEALSRDAVLAVGKALKNLEDRLDALTCAYVAYHCWKHGPEGFRVFGCDEHGSIVTPRLVPGVTCAPERPSP